MGDEPCDGKFMFYLREKLTRENLTKILQTVVNDNPEFTLSHEFEDVLDISYDIKQYMANHEGTNDYPAIRFENKYTIRLSNLNAPRHFDGFEYMSPFINRGERQLLISFEPKEELPSLAYPFSWWAMEDPKLGPEMLPLISTVAHLSKAFLGIFGDSDEFFIKDKSKIYLKDIEFQQEILTQENSFWSTLFFDDILAKEIGLDILKEYANIIERSDDDGYIISRLDLLLTSGTFEMDRGLRAKKDRIFRELIVPKIIKRLHTEYEI